MERTEYLFDMEPFTDTSRPRRFADLPPGLRASLGRLKRTLDALSPEDWEMRRRRSTAALHSVRAR